MDEVLRLAERAWPYLIVLAPGMWALYLRWNDRRKERVTERSDLIKIAQDAAGEVIEDLRAETTRLQNRLKEVERELRELQKRHTEMIADKDAKIALLEGEKRQLQMEIEACKRLLERHGIPAPVQSQAYWVDQGGVLLPAAEQPVEKAQ